VAKDNYRELKFKAVRFIHLDREPTDKTARSKVDFAAG
jgi:hypothetical protein